MKQAPEIDELTPEMLVEAGKEWLELMLRDAPAEYILSHFTPEQRVAGLDPDQMLGQLDPEQRLKGLDPEEIRRYLKQLEETRTKH